MALPTVPDFHYYQGIIIAQVVVMLGLYIILKFFHYIKWGYLDDDDRIPQSEREGKPQPNEQDVTTRKWEQRSWDVYFPILYTNHLAALALVLGYIPYIFETVIAYVHLGGFLGLILVNIFLKDEQPNKGKRTNVSRMFYGLMFVANFTLIIAGLVGVAQVL